MERTMSKIYEESDRLFTVVTPDREHVDQTERDVVLRVRMARNDQEITIKPQSVVSEYTVFYGGQESSRKEHTGWQGWGQPRTVRSSSCRQAVIDNLVDNSGAGTRYAVVGPEFGHPSEGKVILRHFILVAAEEDEPYDYYSTQVVSGLDGMRYTADPEDDIRFTHVNADGVLVTR
jgi:hypothetical protein